MKLRVVLFAALLVLASLGVTADGSYPTGW
jgi:hypothetical protein